MKVLMVRTAGKISGAEVYNFNLVNGFKKYNDVELVYITNSKLFNDRLSDLGVNSLVLDPGIDEVGTKKDLLRVFPRLPALIISYLKLIKQSEKNEKFDLICLQSMTEKIFLTPVLKLFFYKIVWIEHGPLFITSRSKIIKLLYLFSSKFADKIIAVSKNTKSDLEKGGIDRNKIEQIYIGIDTKHFSPDEDKKKRMLKIPQKNFVIGFVGTVCEEKGIRYFFEVAKNLSEKSKNISFIVIGDGELFIWLSKEIKKYEIKNFHLVGQIESVRPFLNIIDIFFFPTKHQEGLPISLLEAMSMETAAVVRDIGGNNELVKHGSTGFLFNSSKEAINFISKLLEDKKLKNQIGNGARNYIVKNFDINKNISNFYSLFKRL